MIRKFAKNFLKPADIALILEIDKTLFIKAILDKSTEISKAYYAGFLQREFMINKKIADTGFTDSLEIELQKIKDIKSTLIILKNAYN